KMENLVGAVMQQVAAACEARGAALLTAEEESGDLVLYLYDASEPDPLRRLGVKAGEGFLGVSMLTNQLIRTSEVDTDPRFSRRLEGSFPFPVTSVLAMPLLADETPAGALGLFSKLEADGFSDEDVALMRLVGANATTALRLFNASAARERTERLGAIGRLLSQVIHDFKTPMTVISGYVQLMQDAEDVATRAEYAEEILQQFDLLTEMQREVLEFSRGERTVFIRRVYLKKFFADLIRQLGRELDGRAIELELDVDTKLVARFDEGRIARAIHNLVRNAIEAMAERGGRLTISAELEDSDIVLRVSDTGPGIPKEIEGRIFQSFVTAGKEGGTGLGLAIVKKIVEEHSGSVNVHSSTDGTTFELRLPQAPKEVKASTEPPKSGPSKESTGTSGKSAE
ncbi:MAG TPA: GAF domain-containing sensor histidine kinase, partial [Polyangiaceae bacterium]